MFRLFYVALVIRARLRLVEAKVPLVERTPFIIQFLHKN